MRKSALRLNLLNFARWFRENWLAWVLLSFIYSVTLVLLLQPFLELALKAEFPFWPLWSVTCAVLLIPAMVEAIPGIGLRIPVAAPTGLMGIYLRHELRRLPTWVGIAVPVVAIHWMPPGREALWLVAAQFPMQRALYSLQRWRTLALTNHPGLGASRLVTSLAVSQFIQFAKAWVGMGLGVWLVPQFFGSMELMVWLRLGMAGAAAVAASSGLAMEGDSGRPWLVNFVTLAAALIAAFATFAWPIALLIVVYFAGAMSGAIRERLRSVEHLDEDLIIP